MLGLIWDMVVLGLIIFNLLDLELEKLEIWDQTIIYAGLKKYKLAPVTILSPLAVRCWNAQW